jgi:hypothetical protein
MLEKWAVVVACPSMAGEAANITARAEAIMQPILTRLAAVKSEYDKYLAISLPPGDLVCESSNALRF